MYTFLSLIHIKAKWSLLFLLGLCTASFQAQTNVVLQMEQLLEGQPFAYDQTTLAELGYYFKATRLQYYISEITLIHDGGQITPVTDYYLLVDPAMDSTFSLGNFAVTDLEKIEFWIGVDSATNHLDPALYPESHPLALKDPSMHWGWAGGYRFIAFEGLAGNTPGFVTNVFQIHTIADENYRKVSLDINEIVNGDSMMIRIQAEYAKLLHKIDVSTGGTSHSSVGLSKQVSINMPSVFSPALLSSAQEPSPNIHFQITPNPASDFVTITLPWATDKPLTLVLTDMQGNKVLEEKIHSKTQTFDLEGDFAPGVYMVTLSDSRQVLAGEKIIVIR